MKRVTCIFIAVCLLIVYWGAPEAKINPLKSGKLITLGHKNDGIDRVPGQVADEFFNDLNIGALWFPAVSNKGYIGYSDLSAYYPGGGDQSNVWQAGMTAGGYVEGRPFAWRFLGSDGGDSDPAQYDTNADQAIVETEADFGYPFPYRRLTTHVNTANKPVLTSGSDEVDA